MQNNIGAAAIEKMLNGDKAPTNQGNGEKGENVKRYLKDGESVLVRIPNLDECLFYYNAHSDFISEIRPHACHQINGEEDLYDKAYKILMKEANGLYKTNPTESKKIWTEAKRFEGKLRIQFGFYSLEDGKPVIFDVSKKFGESIYKQIKKHATKIDKLAFEFSREGEEVNSSYSITPYIDDLTEEQQEFFDASGSTFDVTLFQNTLFFKKEEKQLEDLQVMGFDVSRIGLEPTVGIPAQAPVAPPAETVEATTTETAEIVDEDPFAGLDLEDQEEASA